MKIIIHEIPDSPPALDPFFLLQHFLLTAHDIAILCIKSMTPSKLTMFQTPAFLRSLVTMWISPDSTERQKVSELIGACCMALPSTEEVIVATVRDRLAAAGQDLISHRLVGPACSFLYKYHANLSATHYPSNPGWFVQCCLPLFRSLLLKDFYEPFTQLCDLYCDLFEALPVRTLRALFGCWPKSGGSKKALFVKFMGRLLGKLSDKMAEGIARNLFICITDCFITGPFEVVEEALKLVAKRGFLGRFRPIIGTAFPRLYRAVELYLNAGDLGVVTGTKEVLELLNGIAPGCGKTGIEEGDNDRIENWNTILRMGNSDVNQVEFTTALFRRN
jgi:hypothetical protein